MILWTIKHYTAYESLLRTGFLRADEDSIFVDEIDEEVFRCAYNWMSAKMIDSGLVPPKGIKYPIWAWYKWNGKRKRRDMRESGYAKRGEKIVQLTIEMDDQDVLLSDFSLFHYPLNGWYIPVDEKDDVDFEKLYKSLGYSHHDLRDPSIQSDDMEQIRAKIYSSWDRIFLLDKEDDNWLYGKNENKSIQATFWELRVEQVVKAEIYIAK